MKYSNPVEVLIVDDRLDGLIAIEAILQELPSVKIVRAQSGQEALDRLEAHDFAVILLDVQMPKMDGFQTASAIRTRYDNYKHTPIVFVTAINKEDQYVYKGYEAGAVDYIFKPFEPQILTSKVSVFVELYRKNRQLIEQNERIRESELRDRYLKLTELELESLKRYRSLADAIPHIVWKSNSGGTLDYFNKIWCDYTGLSPEQSMGYSWQNSFEPEDLKSFLKVWIRAIGRNEAFEVEARIRRKDGQMRWHWIRAVPEMRHQNVVAWLGTCTDIHDRKKTEERLIEAEKTAVEANLAKTNFLSNMSHEIRTPLGAIIGYSELMQEPEIEHEERMKCVSTVHRSGQHLLQLINEILDISKVEAGHLDIESRELNFHELLNDLNCLFNNQTQSKKLGFEFQVEGQIPEIVISDPVRIRQVMTNVIGNAIKFTESGKITLKVNWQSIEADAGFICVQVTDTGIGIPVQNRDRLFEPFEQVDSSITRRFGGTGLGLAISRKLARALGGDVSMLSSEPGQGSCFEIKIRTQFKPEVRWVEGLISISPRKEGCKSLRENQVLAGTKILIVDDSHDNQVIIGFFLSAAGASVEYASNGCDGVEKALNGQHDLILMDIQMPEVDGYEATRRLREQGYKIPIMALTAHALKEERDRCLLVGCNDHFTKPVDRMKLISTVESLIRTHQDLSPSSLSEIKYENFLEA